MHAFIHPSQGVRSNVKLIRPSSSHSTKSNLTFTPPAPVTRRVSLSKPTFDLVMRLRRHLWRLDVRRQALRPAQSARRASFQKTRLRIFTNECIFTVTAGRRSRFAKRPTHSSLVTRRRFVAFSSPADASTAASTEARALRNAIFLSIEYEPHHI